MPAAPPAFIGRRHPRLEALRQNLHPLLGYAVRFAHTRIFRNALVMRRRRLSRTIAYNKRKHRNLSDVVSFVVTLLEACASERRGLAISNEEQSDV